MDLLNQAQESMGPVTKVLVGLPGIKGYKAKELRRETDKTVRDMLAKQLEDQKARLDSVQMELVSGGMLSLMDDMEGAVRKLQLLIDRIRTASYGYAPLFDAVQVKEQQLDALVQFDQDMAAGVDRIKTIIDNMGTLGGRPEQEWKEAIRALSATVDTLNTEFGHRNEVILQVGAAGGSEAA